ncbi:hypothetical protein V9T40_011602 [Parthenolecanium corni]|uniref:Integrase catalytic domain-containing protein n=1 Tax=Parthenolecanium corni TaxID=536013 RepID=A0AAN9TL32_9HEMI
MASLSDRELRVIKRTFTKVRDEIDELLLCKLDSEVLTQIEVLFEGNLKYSMEKYDQTAHDFYLVIDETDKDDLELEKKVMNDHSDLRKSYSLMQAKVKKAVSLVRGEASRQSIIPPMSSTTVESRASEQPKLKKIEIPEFDGDLSKFFNFKALFVNLVHSNSDFSNVQKLFYLKQALVGKAAIVLQDCDLAEDAYPEAWAYFLDRYESKRAIVRNFFLKLSSLQQIRSETGIREILDQTMAIIRGLKVAGETVNDTFSRYISFLVASKLDPGTAKDWDNHTCSASEYPKFEELFKFLQGRTFVIDERGADRPKESRDRFEANNSRFSAPKKAFLASTSSSSAKAKCPMCSNLHFLNQCEQFKAMNAHRRYDFAKSNRLCLVCFSGQHTAASCTSKVKLALLKKNGTEVPAKAADGKEMAPKKVYTATTGQHELEQEVIVLPSAIVRFECGGNVGTIRALVDNCSQATLVSDRLVKKHKLPTGSFEGSAISGVSPGVVSPNQFLELSLISRTQVFSIDVVAEVVPPESMNYELHTILDKSELEKLSKYQLADPALVKKPVRITDVDMIIGAKYVGKCLTGEKLEVNDLILLASKFGWLVSGKLKCEKTTQKRFTGLTLKTLENDLKTYFAMEHVGSSEVVPAKSIGQFEKHFLETHKFAVDGKFNLRLPFSVEKSKIANNRRLALKSLFRLETTLEPGLKAEYVKFMREYEALGHMSLVNPTDEPHYCIPHRAVVREESSTTPVRVVFNASSRIKGEISLNEGLMVGPQIQRELFDILISVRSYRFVFSADIEKMYRMMWIDEQDRNMQRIFWRESPDEPVREYQLNTVTYGTASASFLATQCLEVVAREIEGSYPEAAQIIRQNFYMDDLIAGGNNLQQVCRDRQVIHDALLAHGFKLRKYCANHVSILAGVAPELIVNGSNVELVENVAMLGVVWSPGSDKFCIKLNLKLETMGATVTKRLMMSYLARTFDPLGLISPVCLRGKLMIQTLWQMGLDWDVPVSVEVADGFREYLLDLSKMAQFTIPRYCCFPGSKTQLVGFCDASAKAYCAVLYVRNLVDGVVKSCRLICAKTRVAPTKELTIPKLELSSALLLAHLLDRVRKTLDIKLVNCFLFTDATIVLCWLSQPPDEWKTFVSNRVEKIKNLVPYDHWFYVHTSQNPADLATRGLSVAEFLDSPEWLQGPSFLKNSEISSNPIPNLDLEQALEKRKKKVFGIRRVEAPDLFIDKFSSFSRMLRVLAYVIRFSDRHRKFKQDIVVSAAELDNSLIFALKMVQRFYFLGDVDRLSRNLALKADSKLLPLAPFLDDCSILRVGGRLNHSNLSESRKHPIILPAKAQFTRALLRWVHERYFHANRRFLLGYLSSRYWIVGGCSNLVKFVVHSCVQCARYKGETASQLMGQLPPFRVNVSRPFTHTGVDLAGPFQCKCVAHRTTRYYKVYMAIFVCMTVKCVHIEVVTDLSTAKFIEALQRFIARRGAPRKMYSDNATNFVGTRNLVVLNQAEVESFSASEGISWSMIPARSPHFGGVWESAVRSAKYHIARVTDGAVLSYDEYCTLFTRVEAILNSRPLCTSIDQGQEVITPAHFLIGQSLNAVPELESDCATKPLSGRLLEMNKRLRSFWQVWKADYLTQLQRRYKWQRPRPNLEVGQVVLIRDEAPPYQWPLAVVSRVYPDEEGYVRVVDVKTAGSLFKRAITKIVPLPIDVTPDPLKGSVGGVCLDRCKYAAWF